MLKKCKKCGIGFVAKLNSETVHPFRCPVNKLKREKTLRKMPLVHLPEPKPKRVKKTDTEKRCAKYGITVETFKAMEIEQDGRCAICGAVAKLMIDHSHLSLNVRGLLCVACNSGLGLFRDSVSALRNAAKYVEDRQ